MTHWSGPPLTRSWTTAADAHLAAETAIVPATSGRRRRSDGWRDASCQGGDESDAKAQNITSAVVSRGREDAAAAAKLAPPQGRFTSLGVSEGFPTNSAAGPKGPAGAFQRFRDKTLSVPLSFLDPFWLLEQLSFSFFFLIPKQLKESLIPLLEQ